MAKFRLVPDTLKVETVDSVNRQPRTTFAEGEEVGLRINGTFQATQPDWITIDIARPFYTDWYVYKADGTPIPVNGTKSNYASDRYLQVGVGGAGIYTGKSENFYISIGKYTKGTFEGYVVVKAHLCG